MKIFIVLFTLTGLVYFFWPPSFKELKTSVPVSRWKDGQVIQVDNVGPKEKGWVPLSNISKNVQWAVIASEDSSFFSHQGLDLFELKESIKKDVQKKRFARGGSTLTQQLIKNVYLSPTKSIFRKMREMFWAISIEKALTKNEILGFYLNVVQWGPNFYGIKEAARVYFQKTPSEITALEGAFLALLLPSPVKYYEYYRKKTLTPFALSRISRILRVMNRMNFISDSDFELASSQALWGNPFAMTKEDDVTVEEIPEETAF